MCSLCVVLSMEALQAIQAAPSKDRRGKSARCRNIRMPTHERQRRDPDPDFSLQSPSFCRNTRLPCADQSDFFMEGDVRVRLGAGGGGDLGFVSQLCECEQVKECPCVSVSSPVEWGSTHSNSIGLNKAICMCAGNGARAVDARHKWEASASMEGGH